MKTILDIKPMQGLGELKFGASQEDVKKLLGEPDETETIDVEGEIHEVEVWSYFDPGHSIYFEKDLDNVCTNIETENEDALLFGKKVFELDQDAIIALMKENNFTKFEIEKDDELDEVIVFFDEAHLQFVFEKDSLGLVSWAVAMGDDDEIQWP